MARNRETNGVLLTMAGAMCFGTGAVIIKTAYKLQLTGWEFISLQLFFSSLLLMTIYLVRRKQGLETPPSRQKLSRLAVLGSLGTLGGTAFYTLGLQYVGASVGIVLFYTYPAWTALGAGIFYQQKLRWKHYLCLALTLVGTVFTIDFWNINLAAIPPLGVVLLFGSAICYSFFTLSGEKYLAEYSSIEITAFTQSFAFLAFSLFKPPTFLLQVSMYALALGLIMALFTSVFSYWLVLKGIAIIGASKAAIISTFEIPFTIFLAILLLGERLTLYQFIGGALIICSIIFLDIKEKDAEVLVN
ncbi:MAG TPA: DMT family transporter [Bacillota bacterium]|nr:DMT family transporter [Bacillota bacterium]